MHLLVMETNSNKVQLLATLLLQVRLDRTMQPTMIPLPPTVVSSMPQMPTSKIRIGTRTMTTHDEPPLSLADLRHDRRNRIRVYYASGSHHSSPVSWMAYTLLSTQLRYGTVGDLLWLACVGVTDSYVHGRIDKAGYVSFANDLRRHVRRVYPDDDVDRATSAAYAELLDGTGLSNAYTGPHTQLSLSENGKILTQNDEYRFFLLRHTSLWNAMMYSPYVCSKMQLWNGAGMGRWREMLAKMGLPLEQCQQPYAFMKPGLKRRLRDVMNEHAEVCVVSYSFSWRLHVFCIACMDRAD